ncbi:MAG: TPM domain-containing protein [Anaerovoracaceae bacterium]
MMNYFSKSFRPALSVFLAAVLVLAFSFFGTAAAFGAVVSPSSSFYVTDEADVISPDTEDYIVQKNAELEQLCGGQIVVVAVDFLDGLDIEDYAYKIFADWNIGDDDKNNGVLLLLAIGEENYWCMQGKGLENKLTSGTIDDILWEYLEPDFAVGDYDSGVHSVFDALYSEVCSIYGVGTAGSGQAGGYSEGPAGAMEESSGSMGFFSMLLVCFLILVVLMVALYIFTRATRNRQRQAYEEMRRNPQPYDDPMAGSFGTPRPMPTGRRRSRRPVIIVPPSNPPRPSQNRSNRKPPRSGGGFGGGFGGGGFGGGGSFGGGGLGRGGGGISRGGGAGRRGR